MVRQKVLWRDRKEKPNGFDQQSSQQSCHTSDGVAHMILTCSSSHNLSEQLRLSRGFVVAT